MEEEVQNVSSRFGNEILRGSCTNVASVTLYSIGSEALDVCNNFVFSAEESKDKLGDIMKNLEEKFILKCNVACERY